MQRDVKIGLSLGLLLVVVVAALFFRREPQPGSGPPALSDPESLNAAIGERERSPYTLGESDDLVVATDPASPPSTRTSNPSPSRPERPRVSGLLASDDEALHDRLFGQRSVPDPIPAETHGLPPSLAAAEAPAGNGVRTHTIKAGDKLSNLAQKYLGSSSRFQELFEANRGLLKSPNSLPVGVTIVIPAKDSSKPLPPPDTRTAAPLAADVKSANEPPIPERAPVVQTRPTESKEIRKRLFSPSRGGPFSSGRIGLPTRNSATEVPRQSGDQPPESQSPLPRIDVHDQTDLIDSDN